MQTVHYVSNSGKLLLAENNYTGVNSNWTINKEYPVLVHVYVVEVSLPFRHFTRIYNTNIREIATIPIKSIDDIERVQSWFALDWSEPFYDYPDAVEYLKKGLRVV